MDFEISKGRYAWNPYCVFAVNVIKENNKYYGVVASTEGYNNTLSEGDGLHKDKYCEGIVTKFELKTMEDMCAFINATGTNLRFHYERILKSEEAENKEKNKKKKDISVEKLCIKKYKEWIKQFTANSYIELDALNDMKSLT